MELEEERLFGRVLFVVLTADARVRRVDITLELASCVATLKREVDPLRKVATVLSLASLAFNLHMTLFGEPVS